MTTPSPDSRGVPPWLVALFRGLLEAALLAAVAALIVWLGEADLGDLAPWAPIAVLALRQAEGIIDERVDPTRQRGPLGGRPAAPPP